MQTFEEDTVQALMYNKVGQCPFDMNSPACENWVGAGLSGKVQDTPLYPQLMDCNLLFLQAASDENFREQGLFKKDRKPALKEQDGSQDKGGCHQPFLYSIRPGPSHGQTVSINPEARSWPVRQVYAYGYEKRSAQPLHRYSEQRENV